MLRSARERAPRRAHPDGAARVAAWDHPQWPEPKKIGGELTSSAIGPLAQGPGHVVWRGR